MRLLKMSIGLFLSVNSRTHFHWKTRRRKFRIETPRGELAELWASALVGNFDEFETGRDIVAQYGGERPVIFVVGANIGLNELPLSDLDNAEIYSFEPVPDTFAVLQSNFENNAVSNIHRFNIGFSSAAGTYDIGIAEDSGSNSLVRTNETQDTVACEFDTLDGFFEQHDVEKLDFLKIDTEGHDIEVLKGGEKTILSHRPVIQLEINRVGSEQSEQYDIDWFTEFSDQYAESYFEIYRDRVIPIENLASFLNRLSIQNDLLIIPKTEHHK